jgi:asparagine synthetase B (glutamine-hydrolysing)
VSAVRIVGELDHTFAWDGARLYNTADLGPGREHPSFLRGAAATISASEGRNQWRIVRDPLGLNKLFWATQPDGELLFAARPSRLVEVGLGLDEIAAVPRGVVLDLDPFEREPPASSLVPEMWSAAQSSSVDVETAGHQIREQLNRYVGAIAARHGGTPVFVCLSGGIDSSGIAALVADHFPDAVAVSFDLARRGGAVSEDRRMAGRVARDLGLPLLEATVTPDELLEPLDMVLREGIDWRDFNVHAALVNAALARAIAGASERGHGTPLVFTGDLANEFLVDYQPERYRGETYYSLPRLSPLALRSLLVRGLDTCHREVGIFEAWSLALIQPYAVAVDTYMRLPEAALREPDRKQKLSRAIFGDTMPNYVLTRPKTRAQVGGAHGAGGVLAACIDRGIDGATLQRRFADLHGGSDGRSLGRFIRAGRYRARVPPALGLARERA